MRTRAILCAALTIFGAAGVMRAQTLYPDRIPDVWNISAQAAAERLAGPNVTVSNASFTGHGPQLGAFNQGVQAVGFAEGIVLATGKAELAGIFGNGNIGNSMPVTPRIPGSDADLNMLNGSALVYNEGILEFDFITTGTSLSFKYLFGSEEYLEWVGSSYNDAFGFFLSGPGINGPFANNAINLATIAGQPVSVNTVNPLVNASYFFDNTFVPHLGIPTVEGVNAQLQYDGFTWGLVATAAVKCNAVYHMKIAICNSGDASLDSGVFIEMGGLRSDYSSPGPLTVAPSPVCAGEEVSLAVQGDPSWTYHWSSGQSGVGLQTVTTTASLGQNSYSVTAEYLPGCSLSTASPAAMLTVHDPQNSPPQCLGVNGSGSYTATIQVGEQTCFTIPTSDAANERVSIARSGGNAGGSFTDNSASQETGTLCWSPGIADVGFHNLEVTLIDNNTCEELSTMCTITIKVVCDFCPVRVYYERRNPDMYPLPALTVAGESITAGYSVDPVQQDGYVVTGYDPVEFRAPYIDLRLGFIAGPGFQAVVDPNTCLEDCDLCCDGWGGFTVDTHGEGTHNVLSNVFTPNGDGVNDRWEVLDIDHPYCAYGAMAYRLDFFSRLGLVYHHEEAWAMGCCPFQSWVPGNPVISSISWDGRANRGAWFCNGCYVSNGVYNYVLTLIGCNGEVTYTGNVQTFGSPAGMITEPTPPLQDAPATLVADSLVASVPDELLAGAVVAGMEAPVQQPDLYLRPNPATDQVWLEYAPGLARVWLMDATGRRVLEVAPQGAPTTIMHIQELAPASYFLVALDIQGMVHNRKLIKQ